MTRSVKIDCVKSWVENLDLVRPYKIATRLISDVQNVFVEIILSDGSIGYGAASPAQGVTGESVERCIASLAAPKLRWLIQQDITSMADVDRLCAMMHDETMTHAGPGAKAALDIALHDAYGKSAHQPLVNLLGRQHDALPTSITIGIKNVAESISEAHEYVARGFTVLKVKLGDNVIEDIARLNALRKEFGGTITIRVDMNQGYGLEEFEQFYEQTQALDIEFFEQPFPVDAVDDMQQLDMSVRAKIAMDENLVSLIDATTLAEANASGIFNIKLMKCGGLYAARQIATIAAAHNIDLMWGCNDESRISIAAALHVAFSCPNTKYIDLDGSLDLARDIVAGGFTIDKGVMRTINAPGLGVVLI